MYSSTLVQCGCFSSIGTHCFSSIGTYTVWLRQWVLIVKWHGRQLSGRAGFIASVSTNSFVPAIETLNDRDYNCLAGRALLLKWVLIVSYANRDVKWLGRQLSGRAFPIWATAVFRPDRKENLIMYQTGYVRPMAALIWATGGVYCCTGSVVVSVLQYRRYSLLQSVSVHTLYAYGGNEC